MLNTMLDVSPAVEIILSALAVGIAGLIAVGFARLQAYIATKTKNAKIKAALLAISETVETAVTVIQQTFVSQLKKDGKFNKENQAAALDKALKVALANITAETRAQAEVLYPDFEEWLKTQIEMMVFTLMPHSDSVATTKKLITE